MKSMIKNVYPEIDGGKYPVKTEIDRSVKISVDILTNEAVKVFLKYRERNKGWEKVEMKPLSELPYAAGKKYFCIFNPQNVGVYEYTIEVENKDMKMEYGKTLELWVEPKIARFGAWYEMFPRSQGKIPNKSATFKDCEERLEDIKKMGFDVVYLTPIHPIGKTNRKGPNNTLIAGPNDPGSPWAIGDETGGHKAIHPDLGTLQDFRNFVKKANSLGMEVALDIGLQCSPDHPYVKEHPEWFYRRSDGTIHYAENPPKKYEDVYPLNFFPENREEMWNEIKSIFEFWISQGVKIFRVDNPHTKPDEFWNFLIRELKYKYPEVILLSEAFTYFEKLELLAKIGFAQSYTYFTWRNDKNSLIEYFSKFYNSYLKLFLRPNLFTNTPDILPPILQYGGRPAFKFRLVLASTLSTSYGIYSSFELCENRAIPGTESYLNSEKYEYKVWDWDRPGNIKSYISKINQIRKENLALHYNNIKFINSTDDHIIAYMKISPDEKNFIVVVVNLDPFNTQETRITIPIEDCGISSDEEYIAHELITDEMYYFQGHENYVKLDPQIEPAAIFRIERKE